MWWMRRLLGAHRVLWMHAVFSCLRPSSFLTNVSETSNDMFLHVLVRKTRFGICDYVCMSEKHALAFVFTCSCLKSMLWHPWLDHRVQKTRSGIRHFMFVSEKDALAALVWGTRSGIRNYMFLYEKHALAFAITCSCLKTTPWHSWLDLLVRETRFGIRNSTLV